jgi:hypothetical protein
VVDVLPWQPEGNYTEVFVEDNKINGGFATGIGNDTLGTQNASAIIKLGIAIGPRVWWGDGRYGTNQSMGGTVQRNEFSGAFAFGMVRVAWDQIGDCWLTDYRASRLRKTLSSRTTNSQAT